MPDSLGFLNNIGVNTALYPPAFLAFESADQTIPTGFGGLVMTLGTPQLDSYSGWNSGTPTRYTPTSPGWYYFVGGVTFRVNSTGVRVTQVQKNGSALSFGQAGQALSTASFNYPLQVSGLFQMNGTTDYIELYGYQDSGGNINTSSVSTFLMAFRTHL